MWPYVYIKHILPEEVCTLVEERIKNTRVTFSNDWRSNFDVLTFNRPLSKNEQLIVDLIASEYYAEE